jgi:hypothetical protein
LSTKDPLRKKTWVSQRIFSKEKSNDLLPMCDFVDTRQGDQMWVKIARNVAQPIFCQNNAKFLFLKKFAPKSGRLLLFKTMPIENSCSMVENSHSLVTL